MIKFDILTGNTKTRATQVIAPARFKKSPNFGTNVATKDDVRMMIDLTMMFFKNGNLSPQMFGIAVKHPVSSNS